MRCSTSVVPTRPCAASPSSRRSIPTGNGCGRCWRSRSTSAPARPTPWTPCAGCASGSPTSSVSTRRRRSSGSSRRCCDRIPSLAAASTSVHSVAAPRPVVPQHAGRPRARPAPSVATGAGAGTGRRRGRRQRPARCGSCCSPASPASASRGSSATSARQATARGVQVLVGRCHEGDYAPALWPWLGHRARARRGRPRPAAGAAARREPHDARPRAAAPGCACSTRWCDCSSRQAATRPLLLVLEDIHWADASSLQLLRHLAGSGLPAPVAVVCTRRTTEAGDQRGARRHDGGPGPRGCRAGPARRSRHRVRGRAAGRVGRGARPAAGRVRRRGDRRQPVLRAAVRPRAGRRSPTSTTSTPRRCRCPTASATCCTSGSSGCPTTRCARSRRRPCSVTPSTPTSSPSLTGTPVDDCLDLLDLAMTSGLVEERAPGLRVRARARARDVVRRAQRCPPDAAARPGRSGRRAAPAPRRRRRAPTIAHHAHLAAPLSSEHAERACHWLERAAAGGHLPARPRRGPGPVAARRRPTRRPTRSTTIEAKCGAAASLLRMARTVEGRMSVEEAVRIGQQLGRWDLVARAAAIYNGAGVWSWREHGIQDDEFIAVLTEATAPRLRPGACAAARGPADGALLRLGQRGGRSDRGRVGRGGPGLRRHATCWSRC